MLIQNFFLNICRRRFPFHGRGGREGKEAKTVNPALLYVFREVKLGRWQLSWGEQLGVAVAPLGGAVSPAPPAQGSSL